MGNLEASNMYIASCNRWDYSLSISCILCVCMCSVCVWHCTRVYECYPSCTL